MGNLLKGGSPHGSSENDTGHNTPDPNAGKVPSESEIVMHSEKNTPGSKTEVGFNPTKS